MVHPDELQPEVVYFQATLSGVDERIFVHCLPARHEGEQPVFIFADVEARRPYRQREWELKIYHHTPADAWQMVVDGLRERLATAEAQLTHFTTKTDDVGHQPDA